MSSRPRRTFAALAVVAGLTTVTAACASTNDAASTRAIADVSPRTAAPGPTATTVAKKDPGCNDADPTPSYRPPGGPIPAAGQMPAGTAMAAIAGKHELRVGVDENTIGFSYRDPDTTDLVGFEADLAREVGSAMGVPVRLVTVTTPQKIDFVESGKVDMTISVVSISCPRWAHVDFSTPYYAAFQQLMVRGDSKIASQADLPGKRVCVTAGSSSEVFLQKFVPDARRRPVETRTECLTRLQEGTVDAIVLPSSIMAGLARQDPTMQVLSNLVDNTGNPATNIYGIAVQKTPNHEFARYLNALLEQWRADDTLDHLQTQNLEHGFPDDPPKPAPLPSYRVEQ